MDRRFAHRFIGVLALLTFTTTLGCSSRPPTINITTADEAESLVGERVIFYVEGGRQTLWVKQVEFPYIYGTKRRHSDELVRLDLRNVNRMERALNRFETTDYRPWTFIIVVGVTLMLIILLN